MMTKIKTKDIFESKVIKRALRESNIHPYIIKAIINEELTLEASSPKGNLGAKVRNVVNRALGLGLEPIEVAKLISDTNGERYKDWVASIESIEDPNIQKDLMSYLQDLLQI